MPRTLAIMTALLMLAAGAAQAALRGDGSTRAPATIAHEATHVPARSLNKVGTGGTSTLEIKKLSGAPLARGGKPELLSFELAWCPHCAADSWALAVALSRFGKLTGLRTLDSGTLFCTKYHAKPCFPHTDGLSFIGAHFKSRFLTFVSVVLQDVKGHNLQKPTKAEQNAINSFDSSGVVPAIDVGGVYGLIGAGYSPGVLAHKTWSQIASRLARASGRVGRRIDGLANLFTAAICKATGGKPAHVCSSKGVAAGAATLAAS